MSRRGLRKLPVDEDFLINYEVGTNSPIWDAYEKSFKAMFARQVPLHQDDEAILLFSDERPKMDWQWYITYRYDKNKIKRTYRIEIQLYRLLFGKNPVRLVYLHGHTGSGKTTMLYHFFDYFIPNKIKWNPNRLKKFKPVKIPFAHTSPSNLESIWDSRVYDFLYKEFKELTDRVFIQNLARFISYPADKGDRKLVMTSNGTLKAIGYPPQFINDTERHIADTYKGISKKKVYEWISNDISIQKDLSLGKIFNKYVIQLLAKYYNYQFVFVIDNIDDMSIDLQNEICRITSDKMRSYASFPTIKFIIATRENLIQPIMTETLPVTRGINRDELELPPIPFADALRLRKKEFFDPLAGKKPKKIEIGEHITFTIEHLDGFLEAVFDVFDNAQPLVEFHKLANHNVRQMLKIVETVFRCPHIDKVLLRKIVLATTEKGLGYAKEAASEFLLSHRIVDAIVRDTNWLVAKKSTALVPNIYFSGSANHYSSTLCRIFIISMVINSRDYIEYGTIETFLSELGHPINVIHLEANNLLQMKIIFSANGFKLLEDNDERALQGLETRDLPYGEFLLEEIGASLRYLQAMAYVTPLEKDYLKLVEIPSALYKESRNISIRLQSASALYKQILTDTKAQIKFVNDKKKSQEKSRLMSILTRFGLLEIIENIREHIWGELDAIRIRKPDILKDIDLDGLFPKL